MEIYALKGHKVRCIGTDSVYHYLTERAEKYLEVGKEYTVERTTVHSWQTDVELQEFPGVEFNSEIFEDLEESSEEDRKKHPDYWKYH